MDKCTFKCLSNFSPSSQDRSLNNYLFFIILYTHGSRKCLLIFLIILWPNKINNASHSRLTVLIFYYYPPVLLRATAGQFWGALPEPRQDNVIRQRFLWPRPPHIHTRGDQSLADAVCLQEKRGVSLSPRKRRVQKRPDDIHGFKQCPHALFLW